MAKNKEKVREPLISITKRDQMPFYKSLIIRAAAIIIALVVCGIITIFVTGDNPISVYATMIEGNFGSANQAWVTFKNMAVLLCISLAVTPAFRMKFWNIGAEGQVLIGGLATAVCMFYLGGKIPEPALMAVMAAASILASAVWGFLPAFFKAYWKTNETLFTLMMNYIAIQLVEFFLKIADKSGSNVVGPSILSHGWFPDLFGQKALLIIVIVAVLTVLLYIYLNYTKHGYEISVVGESENTARYIGINVKKVIIRTMLLSGAICGITGLMLVGMDSHSIDANIAGGDGFTAIMVSWLAKFNPFAMIFSSFLLVFLGRGAEAISTKFGLNASFSSIITGIILFFIIGCEFFINYKVRFNSKKKQQNADSGRKEMA